jgi:hypothetical protein
MVGEKGEKGEMGEMEGDGGGGGEFPIWKERQRAMGTFLVH